MSNLERHTTLWAEMKPDIYAGENFDEVKPMFECQAEGDMSADTTDTIVINASQYPPGTVILVQEPCCPKCMQVPEMCRATESCDFDWDNWCEEQYS